MAATAQLSDATWALLSAVYSVAQLEEIVLLPGFYRMMAGFINYGGRGTRTRRSQLAIRRRGRVLDLAGQRTSAAHQRNRSCRISTSRSGSTMTIVSSCTPSLA